MLISAPTLAALPWLKHGFFTRQGGVSEGIYASLNCRLSSQDSPANVAENRRRVMAALGAAPADLCVISQIHSATVHTLTAPDPSLSGDAMVTTTPGLVLAVATADCAPILFADKTQPIIGAAHSGWKGSFEAIGDNVLTAMERVGSQRQNIAAVIGPCIHQPSYEVGPEFFARFHDQSAAHDAFFTPAARAEHWLFDLPGFIAARLKEAGIGHVEALPHDTLADEAQFFSYRRTTLAGGGDFGSQLSAIRLL